jgi:TetR/AcrR family transcriptional repressor of nem operon
MPRASKEDAARHRTEIIKAAAKLFRERGIEGVSVPDLMETVGLTHGGFYRHFASKDELADLALGEAFAQSRDFTDKIRAGHPDDAAAARRDYIDFYLSPGHRANRGTGCPNAALSGDIGRSDRGSPVRGTYASNLKRALETLSGISPGRTKAESRQSAIQTLSSLVGALVLARASQGDPVSDEILETVKASLLPAAGRKSQR